MYQYGSRGQGMRDPLFDASGVTVSTTAPLLVMPERKSTTMLTIQNISSDVLWVEFGSARAVCAITDGAVSGFTITNGGFGFTSPPDVVFLGGGYNGNTAALAVGLPGYSAPGAPGTPYAPGDPAGFHPAKAHAVLTAGVVTSIEIEDAGSGYAIAPYVLMINSQLDPYGCADPSVNSGSGILLPQGGGSATFDSNFCTTDSIAIFGATASQAFTVKWAP